jgi:hypothetical protein
MFVCGYEQHLVPPAPSVPKSLLHSRSWSSAASAQHPSITTSSILAAASKPVSSTKLNPAELTNHRCKGLYFHCVEKFSQGHKEDYKRIFVIEVLGDDA